MMQSVSELEEVRGKVEENSPTQLRLYPNRSLLGRSRPLRSSSEHFDRRCSLFIECTYLLLRVEAEQTPAFLSRSIFTNPAEEVYYFYSFDPQFEGRLVRVAPGNLVQNIISYFHAILGTGGEQLQDYEQQALLDNTAHCLIPYFDELREKSEKYYYQEGEAAYHPRFRNEPSNPHAVLLKLEASELYREHNLPLKCATAVLARGITDLALSPDLQPHFVALAHQQEGLLRELGCLSAPQAVAQAARGFYLQVFRFLQLLQKEAFLKVTVSEADLEAADAACLLTFQSNLRREPHVNKTSNEKSSESSIRNDRELTKEQREKLVRQREYLDNLAICKNRINFTVRVALGEGGFAVEAEAVSRWAIDEVYFLNFLDFWTLFANAWHVESEREERLEEEVCQLRFEAFHRAKNIGLRSSRRLPPHAPLIQALVLLYDQAALLFLLFEEVLKKMYKLGTLAADFSERGFQELREGAFVEGKVARLRSLLLKYSQHYRRLTALIAQ